MGRDPLPLRQGEGCEDGSDIGSSGTVDHWTEGQGSMGVGQLAEAGTPEERSLYTVWRFTALSFTIPSPGLQ